MLDTFNEVLIQNFSRRHRLLAAAFASATPPASSASRLWELAQTSQNVQFYRGQSHGSKTYMTHV